LRVGNVDDKLKRIGHSLILNSLPLKSTFEAVNVSELCSYS